MIFKSHTDQSVCPQSILLNAIGLIIFVRSGCRIMRPGNMYASISVQKKKKLVFPNFPYCVNMLSLRLILIDQWRNGNNVVIPTSLYLMYVKISGQTEDLIHVEWLGMGKGKRSLLTLPTTIVYWKGYSIGCFDLSRRFLIWRGAILNRRHLVSFKQLSRWNSDLHVMCVWFTQYTRNVGWLIAVFHKSTLWWFAPFLGALWWNFLNIFYIRHHFKSLWLTQVTPAFKTTFTER